ncbi:MAG: kelch repeat-containing protein [Bdellovibrionia bacterium]
MKSKLPSLIALLIAFALAAGYNACSSSAIFKKDSESVFGNPMLEFSFSPYTLEVIPYHAEFCPSKMVLSKPGGLSHTIAFSPVPMVFSPTSSYLGKFEVPEGEYSHIDLYFDTACPMGKSIFIDNKYGPHGARESIHLSFDGTLAMSRRPQRLDFDSADIAHGLQFTQPLTDFRAEVEPLLGKWRTAYTGWVPMSSTGDPGARWGHNVVWTGTEMLVWGGSDPNLPGTGGVYDPATDSWRQMTTSGAPSGRMWAVGIWTWSGLVIWGGEGGTTVRGDGATYNPAANSWTAIPAAGAPSARKLATVAFAGKHVVIWGGTNGTVDFNDGARLDTSLGNWSPMIIDAETPAARQQARAVWTGRRMIVWGGTPKQGTLPSGGAYLLETDDWVTMPTYTGPDEPIHFTPIWSGTEMIVWGGRNGGGLTNFGAIYNPATNIWRTMSTAGAPSPRESFAASWTGNGFLVWGGYDNNNTFTNDGGFYDLATDTWRPISTAGAPPPRGDTFGVWTGIQFMVYGGFGNTAISGGGRFTPTN